MLRDESAAVSENPQTSWLAIFVYRLAHLSLENSVHFGTFQCVWLWGGGKGGVGLPCGLFSSENMSAGNKTWYCHIIGRYYKLTWSQQKHKELIVMWEISGQIMQQLIVVNAIGIKIKRLYGMDRLTLFGQVERFWVVTILKFFKFFLN